MQLQRCLRQWDRKGSAGVGGMASMATGVNSSCHWKVVPLPKHTDAACTASAYLKLMAKTCWHQQANRKSSASGADPSKTCCPWGEESFSGSLCSSVSTLAYHLMYRVSAVKNTAQGGTSVSSVLVHCNHWESSCKCFLLAFLPFNFLLGRGFLNFLELYKTEVLNWANISSLAHTQRCTHR